MLARPCVSKIGNTNGGPLPPGAYIQVGEAQILTGQITQINESLKPNCYEEVSSWVMSW